MKASFLVAVIVRDLKFDTIYTKYISGNAKEEADAKLKIFLSNILMATFELQKFYVNTQWIVTGSKKACVKINKQIAHETWCNGFEFTMDEITLHDFVLLGHSRKAMIDPFRVATGRVLSIGAINTQVQNLLRKLNLSKDTMVIDLYNA